MKSDLVDVPVEIVRETFPGSKDQGAVLVVFDERKPPVWLPKSAIEINHGDPVPGSITVTLPERMAVEKGLV